MARLLFVFDMDEVLYRYDWPSRMTGLAELTGVPVEELIRRWWHVDGEEAAEAGRFADADAYHAAFCAALGPVSVDAWIANRAGAMTPWPASHDAVRRAAELGRVSLLTNNGPLLQAHLARIAPEIAPLFGEHLFTSSHYGARKPDPVVFERMLAAYDADPADTFFADDLPENVAAAASVGITAHLFTSGERMRAAIEEFAAGR